jgi:hypothetical protein
MHVEVSTLSNLEDTNRNPREEQPLHKVLTFCRVFYDMRMQQSCE